MFSKLNQEFASHQKGFQILLGIVIIVPFVLMIPGVDPFGSGGPSKPENVGTIAGQQVTWDEYEKETRNLLAMEAIRGNFNALNNAREIINSDSTVNVVLKYMADKKIIEDQKSKGFKPGEITADDYREFTSKIEKEMSARIPGFKVTSQIESIRVRLRIGGEEVDRIISEAIVRERFEEYLKKQVKIDEAALTAEIKKQEKSYKIHEGTFNYIDFRDEPLKEYYEKNKEKFFRKDAVKASVIAIPHNKFEEDYKKLSVEPEKLKFIADELKKVDNKDPKVVESATKTAELKFKQKKLAELALAKANMIKDSFLRNIKGSKDTATFAKAIETVAKAVKYDVQQSVYVDPADVEKGKAFMNDIKLSEKILGLTAEKPADVHEGFRSTYLVVLNDKGAHAEFNTVRNEILKAVYEADSNNYYLTNKEEFKMPHMMTVGVAEFTPSLFSAETKVTEEEVKSVYEKEPAYQKPQRKLIQFSVKVDAKATDEDKKKLEEKLNAFVAPLKGQAANSIENLIIKPEEKIEKNTLDWKIKDSLQAGTNKKFMDAAFSVQVGQFTEVLKTNSLYAVIYVAGEREKTPIEEVKGEIRNRLELAKSQEIAKSKADEFYLYLKGITDKSVAGINKAIQEYEKKNALQIRYLNDIMPMKGDENLDPRIFQMFAQRHRVSPDFFFNICTLNKDRLFTRVKTLPPTYHKALGFIKEDIPEHYQSFEEEEVKLRIYNSLNDNKAKELAAAHAVKVKQELEKNVADAEKLKALLKEYKFAAAKEVKFKDASVGVKAVLKDSPKEGFIGSESINEGARNTVVYVESVKEVSEEDLKKFEDEHRKRMTEEKEDEKISKFWEEERKKYSVEVAKTMTAES